MARKFTATQVKTCTEAASARKQSLFILEAVEGKKKSHLRLKGTNGEPIMHQECTSLRHARYMAARLISGGLDARYRETTA